MRRSLVLLIALVVIALVIGAYFYGRDSHTARNTTATTASIATTTTSTSTAATTATNPPARPHILVTTSCRVGTFLITEQGFSDPGERITVTDNWSAQPALGIATIVVVIYDNGTEVGSVVAGPQQGGQDAARDLDPYPVYLTFGQTQIWTLAAGWQGNATSCTVPTITSSPQVPLGQLGTSDQG